MLFDGIKNFLSFGTAVTRRQIENLVFLIRLYILEFFDDCVFLMFKKCYICSDLGIFRRDLIL